MLAQIGIVGYAAFWLWFAAPLLGRIFSLVLPFISVIYLIFTLREWEKAKRDILSSLIPPVALTGIATLLVLSAGFLYGGFGTPLSTAATRFSHPLPVDNELPDLFARDLSHGHSPKQLYGDWLSSDRPPLQTGIYLSEYPYFKGQKGYETVSALLQSLWIFALYILLSSLQLNIKAIRLALATCLFSGFVFLNTFFVWPKLLAAAYILGFSALFLSRELLLEVINNRWKAILGGSLLTFALLSHGGSVFSILGLGLAALILRSRVVLDRKLLIVLISCFCLYLPWTLYQKIYNPPGDRLLKWMLAGVVPVTPLPFGHLLFRAYADSPPRQILDNKLDNFKTALDYQADYWPELSNLLSHLNPDNPKDTTLARQAAYNLRAALFFHFVVSLQFLMFGPCLLLIGIVKRRRSLEWIAATKIYLYVGLSLLVWCLVMFGPATTTIQSGSYANNLLAVSAAILAFWVISPRLAYLIAALQIALAFLLYGVFTEQAVPAQPIHVDLLILWLFSLPTLVFFLSKLNTEQSQEKLF